MAGLEGTIKTPLGPVQKKTALILGGGVVVLGFIVWYRQKQLGDTTVTAEDAPINPATGYPYGSAEDAAALAQQGAYVSPPANPGGGGGSAIPPSNLSFSSNGQWVQAVVEYMTGADLIEDPSALSAALGKYVTGAYVTDTDVSLIQQAIAVEGFPPIGGPNGYPPSLNRNAPTTTTPPTTTSALPGAITNRVTTLGPSSIHTSFSPAANAVKYSVSLNGAFWNEIGGSPFVISNLKAGQRYTVTIRGVNKDGAFGPGSNSTVTAKK